MSWDAVLQPDFRIMKNIPIFAFILFCLSCAEENPQKLCDCRMYFSSAQPIEFWLTGCETFNEKDVCGAHPACFCTPFNCDDEIRIQFTDDDEEGEFTLRFFDEDSVELFFDTFSKTDLLDGDTYVKSVYDYSFTPSTTSPDLCNKKVQAKVYSVEPIPGTEDPFVEYLFTSDLNGWFNTANGVDPATGGSTSDWAWSADLGGTAKNTTVDTFGTKMLRQSSVSVPQQMFFIRIKYQILNANSDGLFLRFIIRDSGNNQLQNDTFSTPGPHASIQTATIQVTDEDVWLNADHFLLSTTSTDYDAGDVIYIDSIEIYTEQEQEVEVAKSDCIHIKESHACTQLITYRNERNYAGLIYQNESPEIQFKFRIPVVFFRPRFPKTQQALDLSDATIALNSQIKVQRLFDTDFLPSYIHKKLNLIFAHQYIEIDNQTWVCEEEYEMVETNRHNQTQKARVWLTESDFIARNVV